MNRRKARHLANQLRRENRRIKRYRMSDHAINKRRQSIYYAAGMA